MSLAILFLIRTFQAILSILLIIISSFLMIGQSNNSVPAAEVLAMLAGATGFVAAVCGFIALVQPCRDKVVAAYDGITAFLGIVGGIAFAAAIGTGSCSNAKYMSSNLIISIDSISSLFGRCVIAKTEIVALFVTVPVFAGMAWLGWQGQAGYVRRMERKWGSLGE